ncbi:ABC transporter G family member 35 isoform X1 [Dendrobium catenatum]|uniref:ABC transporter G family member 35 isoform X1 n=1 Tax=Dendrobium catenatum TaxID=906689 RepID=UPI0010A040B3|nr:ABC transporter G family member 35 isoform X1 [Dendrobium catenatum]
MEAGSVLRATSSRSRRSSIWNGDQVFSRSRHSEDDEEDLTWAAIERLPTYNRMRKGILNLAEGGKKEVDIESLGFLERRELLEKLVRVADDDNEKFLLRIRNRIDNVGIELPTIEVRYENLNVKAEAYVGNRGLPTLLNSVKNVLEAFANNLHILPSRKKPLTLLHNVSGLIKPRRMTLLLGPPGSGKTTLLLALAGKLDSDVKVSGRVTYNGQEMNKFVPQRNAAYISQYDVHIGEMTVRETLSFSARCQGVGKRYDMLAELSRREKAANIKPDPDVDVFMKASSMEGQETGLVTDYVLKILGLDICADTMIGDEMIRGISGGQKKRVTTGEMIVGPASALFMDEISTGLDTSTTYQIVSSLRQYIHILDGTAVISLLQPAPETFDLFDDIILLSDAQIVYHGPRENVLEFFELMGFKCPERKGVADFLQEVTSRKDQQQYWARDEEPYRYVTAREFSEAFQSFHIGDKLTKELAVPFDARKGHPAALTTSKYGVSKKELLKACISRELLLMKRNWFAYVFRAIQLLLLASIAMTLFLRTNMHRDSVLDGGIFVGSLFFSIQTIVFNGLTEIPLTIWKLPVFLKQRDYLFYPAWAYTLPSWILKIPIALVEVGTWVFVSYYVIGYDPNVGRFFKQYLLFLALQQAMSAFFRLIAGLSRDMVVANSLGSFALLVVVALAGFVLSHDDMKKWWIWGYWISPMMYSLNALATNEFLGKSWKHILPGSTESLGVTILKSRGTFTEAKWYWIGFGALIGFIFLFNFLFTVALTFVKPFGKSQPIISEETLKEKQANITGEITEISSTAKSSEGFSTSKTRRNENRIGTKNVEAIAESKLNKKGMVLPFAPLLMTFQNIRYSVDMPQEIKAQGAQENRLELLRGVSGCFRPGVLTALMGVTGAGKTTLLDVLAGRKTGGYVEGSIMINGYPKKQITFARVSGYCEQNDIHSPLVTVYESLVYSAWLRLPVEVDSSTRKMFIEEVMELLELAPLRGALIGLPGVNGLTREQRKRLTISVELVSNPTIIFMDEPTSGLDARAAAIVMRTVRNIVDTGRTVVCTIHQPSIDIFEAFDELFLMKRGGQEIYVGPLGHHSCHIIEYFERFEGVGKIKDGYNPATWMLEVTTRAQEERLGIDFSDSYKNSALFQKNKSLITELSIPPPESSDLYFATKYSQSFVSQCMICLWKQHLSYWRNLPYTATRYLFTSGIALIFGTIFWDLGSKMRKQQDLFNAMGSMYTAVLFIGVSNSSSVQPVVSVERTVFYRERAAGMYSSLPYAFGQVAIEIPYVLGQAIVYGVIVYSMIGFEWTTAKFFWYLFIMYFTFLYFTYYGMMCVGFTPNLNVGTIASTWFYLLWNLFSGMIIPRPRVPVWWRWYFWACPVSWTLYGLVASQFGDIEDKLDTGEVVSHFVRNYFGFRHDFLGVVAAAIVGFPTLFAFLFGFSIKALNFQRR